MKIRFHFPFPTGFIWYSPWQVFWGLIFNLCEELHVNLGSFAPWVFGQMIGRKARLFRKEK